MSKYGIFISTVLVNYSATPLWSESYTYLLSNCCYIKLFLLTQHSVIPPSLHIISGSPQPTFCPSPRLCISGSPHPILCQTLTIQNEDTARALVKYIWDSRCGGQGGSWGYGGQILYVHLTVQQLWQEKCLHKKQRSKTWGRIPMHEMPDDLSILQARCI